VLLWQAPQPASVIDYILRCMRPLTCLIPCQAVCCLVPHLLLLSPHILQPYTRCDHTGGLTTLWTRRNEELAPPAGDAGVKRFGVSRGMGLGLAVLWLALLIGGIALRQTVDWQVTSPPALCQKEHKKITVCKHSSQQPAAWPGAVHRCCWNHLLRSSIGKSCRCWTGGRPSSAPAPSSLGAARWGAGAVLVLLTTRAAA
jgi:hypothetical protein